MKKNKGGILIFSGAAGSGKGTVLQELFKLSDRFSYSVSMTSRKPRPGEVDGVSYFFVTREEFEKNIKENKFLEWAEYVDNYYGTPLDYVLKKRDEGYIVILEIDTVGAINVMKMLDDYISVFVAPPSYEELEKRLRGRGTEPENVIKERLLAARTEIQRSKLYQHILINPEGRAEDTARALLAITTGEGDYDKSLLPDGSEEFINNFFNTKGEKI